MSTELLFIAVRFTSSSTISPSGLFLSISFIFLFFSFFFCSLLNQVGNLGLTREPSADFHPSQLCQICSFPFLVVSTVAHQQKNSSLPCRPVLTFPVATEWSKSGNQFNVIMTNESRRLARIFVRACVGHGCWEITNESINCYRISKHCRREG